MPEPVHDWIVAGLGNPGARYAGTRHDLGFALVGHLADEQGVGFRRLPDAEVAGPIQFDGGGRALLVKPQRYMNRSGRPLARLLETEALTPARLLVACDDVNLPLGRVRLRPGGSDGGHNGLKSIIEALGEGFPRLRLGVGSAPPGWDQAEWVLEGFEESEREAAREMLERAAQLVREVVSTGVAAPRTSGPAGPERDEGCAATEPPNQCDQGDRGRTTGDD